MADSEVQAMLRKASPVHYVSGEMPPTLLIHGAEDDIVVVDSTDELVAAMKREGGKVSYLRFLDGSHAVMGQKSKETMPAMLQFFADQLQ